MKILFGRKYIRDFGRKYRKTKKKERKKECIFSDARIIQTKRRIRIITLHQRDPPIGIKPLNGVPRY